MIDDTTSHQIKQGADDPNQSSFDINRRKLVSLASLGVAGMLFSRNCFGQQQVIKANSITISTKEYMVVKKQKPVNPVYKQSEKSKPSQVDMRRSKAEELKWIKLENELKEVGILSDDKLAVEFKNINYGFSFYQDDMDDQFIESHVEPLIDQAADLLDRCLKDRSTYDDLCSKLLYVLVEVEEFRKLDQIHLDEQKAGIYETPYNVSLAQYEAERHYQASLKAVQQSLSTTFETTLDNNTVNEVRNAMLCNAWLSGLPSFYQGTGQFTYLTPSFNNVKKQVDKHYLDNAKLITKYNLALQRTDYELNKLSNEANLSLSEKRLFGLKKQADWEREKVRFQQRRTVVARDLQDFKAKAALDADGALNYAKRIIPLKQRFARDFRDALARIQVVEKGLKKLYGYDFPYPKDETAIDYYDQCLMWTRHVIQWVLKFSRNEQNTVIPISLKQIIAPAQFNEMIKSGEIKFDLIENHFPGMCNIRLRGLSLHSKEHRDSENRLWKIIITPPKESRILHFLTGKSAELSQAFVEPCFFGRVFERHLNKAPDIIGITSLYNVSPLGKWKINVLGAIPSQNSEKLEDIIIDFQLAFRWNRTV